MFENYISFFNNGDVNLHKEASKHWIKDKGPTVETCYYFDDSSLQFYYFKT